MLPAHHKQELSNDITLPMDDTVDSLRVEVWDTGSGLQGLDSAALFEPFSQGKIQQIHELLSLVQLLWECQLFLTLLVFE